jgi:hypothetical protein
VVDISLLRQISLLIQRHVVELAHEGAVSQNQGLAVGIGNFHRICGYELDKLIVRGVLVQTVPMLQDHLLLPGFF